MAHLEDLSDADLLQRTGTEPEAFAVFYRRHVSAVVAWLIGIARNALRDSVRAGQVEHRARRALGIPPLELRDEDLARVEELADLAASAPGAEGHLPSLEAGTRAAVTARVIAEQDYAEIARELQCSEAVVGQRVSRGLAALRARLEGAG